MELPGEVQADVTCWPNLNVTLALQRFSPILFFFFVSKILEISSSLPQLSNSSRHHPMTRRTPVDSTNRGEKGEGAGEGEENVRTIR